MARIPRWTSAALAVLIAGSASAVGAAPAATVRVGPESVAAALTAGDGSQPELDVEVEVETS